MERRPASTNASVSALLADVRAGSANVPAAPGALRTAAPGDGRAGRGDGRTGRGDVRAARPSGRDADQATLIPPTRYQGSKRKLCTWIASRLAELEFYAALDAFGGTGSVSYMLKARGKQVTYNDLLRSNEQIAIALIENDTRRLADRAVDRLLRLDSSSGNMDHPTFVADTFDGIYFTADENLWIDRVRHRIVTQLADRYERAVAWYALFQSAIAKRPYNLFHRKNLYMRTADVARSFGNKRTWDRSFDDHFRAFVERAGAAVLDGGGSCKVLCSDVLEVCGTFDLVYIDTPYITRRGVGVDYAQFYHFLEGLLDYDTWSEKIDWNSKHLKLRSPPSVWTNPKRICGAFADLFERFADSILVVSYRSDGIPTIEELVGLLRRHKRRIDVHQRQGYQYVLSRNRGSNEVLIVAR